MNYWQECIEIAFEEAGITATKEQIENVAGCVEGAFENYGMAHGYDCIPNQTSIENERLRTALIREREKTICPECKGSGREINYGPIHSSETDCYKCHGTGFIYYD